MIGVGDIINRLKTRVPDLGNRVQGAADLLRLTQSGGEPQITPVAFVIPSGILASNPTSQTGAYIQPVERLYSVTLILRSDTTGLRVLDRIDALIAAIIDAIVGWDVEMTGLFTLKRAQVIRSAPGSLSYDISFGIADRIKKAIPS